ncbi:hypothetical protein MNV49_006723 [Pseudohyphozyma bogoriensis]|nr:hypothetical protein MNV49_006723 [Pseudohyphozyma bogoriensis]
MMRFYILDAFTDTEFKGNPAAVVLSSSPLSAALRSSIAQELNQPAAAFVSHPQILERGFADGKEEISLWISWTSAKGEPMPLCGHGSIAATILFLQHLYPHVERIKYSFPRSGRTPKDSDYVGSLAARKVGGRVEVDLPCSRRPVELEGAERKAVLDVLMNATGEKSDSFKLVAKALSNDPSKSNLLVHISSPNSLKSIPINPDVLNQLPFRGFFFTAPPPSTSPDSKTFETRVFFPSVGIPEDQVCGSAHTMFGPYWATTLPYLATASSEGSGVELEAHQVSRRTGRVGMKWDGKWGDDGGIVGLRGEGKVIAQGELVLPKTKL